MNIRGAFLAMVEAQNAHYDQINISFESGIHPLFDPYLDAIKSEPTGQLIEYLSTSMPTVEHVSYIWTFHDAKGLVRLLPDTDFLDRGYFAFAEADSNLAGISLKDGKVYSSVCSDGLEFEANSIVDFIGVSRERWLNDT